MLIETLPGVQALAPVDKWILMKELWQDLNPQKEDAAWEQKVFEILEKRFAEDVADPTTGRSETEVFERLAERKKAWKQLS